MKIKNSFIRLAVGAVFAAIGYLAVVYAKTRPDFVSNVYAPFSRTVCGFLGKAFSIFPFSFVEVFVIFGGVAIFISLVTLIFTLKKPASWFRWLSYLAVIGGIIYFAFVLTWGLNYYAQPLADSLSLKTESVDRESLYEAADYYLEMTNEYSALTTRYADGTANLGSFEELAAQCHVGYEKLAEKYPMFAGTYSKPKKVTHSKIMSKTQITGVFCPFTGECNVNPDSAPANLPFTMLHEMAHRLGVSPENEANFAAYLACRESAIPEFKYSGYYSAFVYVYNAVSKVDSEKQRELWNGLSDEALADVLAAMEHYKKNQGKVSETVDKVNDTYLKAMDQQSGTESYGEVVDLLVADYLQNVK